MSLPVWLVFEQEVLDQLGVGASFSAVSIAQEYGIDGKDASEWIQRYLSAQRSPKSQTKYMLHRQARTTAAVWTIGARTKDARDRLGQFGDDIITTLRRAVRPDIHRLAEVNPRAARVVGAALDPLLDSVGQTVKAVMIAVGWDPDEES